MCPLIVGGNWNDNKQVYAHKLNKYAHGIHEQGLKEGK